MKKVLLLIAITLIPLFGIALADDCFDTVIDKDGKVFYIDPSDEYSFFEDREKLVSIYWDKVKCDGGKKLYSSEEYIDKMYNDMYKQMQKKEESSWTKSLIELIMGILWCVAMWKIFVKAWKSGISAIIPIYNFYELSDIAWLQWLFWKAFLCLVAWMLVYFFIPVLWFLLIAIFGIYGVLVNFNVARNFWWSIIASILYVIFNPIAMLILAFWNDEYYITQQKNRIQDEMVKRELENLANQWVKEQEEITEKTLNTTKQTNTNIQNEEIKIKNIDPNDINW